MVRGAGTWPTNPAPVATAPTNSMARAASAIFLASMDLSTSRASPVANEPATCPAAKLMAALVVTSHREDETAALAAVESRTAARAEVDRKAPRRREATAELIPRRANRLRSVPSGQRSRRAASSS